jgi:hypothetical protein
LNVHRVSEVRQIEIHTAEPLVPDPRPFEIEITIEKFRRYKLPGSDQILGELIQAGGEMLHSKIHKLINFIWNTEELPDQWKESIIAQVHKKGDKTDCSNYCGLSLLSISYKILSNITLSRLSPYIDEIIGDHHCGFRCKRSPTDQIFCIHQILEKKWEYKETVHQLFIDFKKACDSVRREVLYNILIEFRVPMNLVRLIKMCLKVCIGKHLYIKLTIYTTNIL